MLNDRDGWRHLRVGGGVVVVEVVEPCEGVVHRNLLWLCGGRWFRGGCDFGGPSGLPGRKWLSLALSNRILGDYFSLLRSSVRETFLLLLPCPCVREKRGYFYTFFCPVRAYE